MCLELCRRRLTATRLSHRGAALLLMLVFVVPAATVSAQPADPQQPPQSELSQLSLEQLADLPIDSVFSASMYLQKVTEAPSSVTIITADEIREFGHRTLADVLRTVRGFYVTYDRNYSYLGVRGFSRPGDYNARVLLQVDGHRLNDNVFGSALLGTEFPLDVDLIERIEIIRGPSSALYGTSAFFAVINVITKHGSTEHGLEASGTLGSFDSYEGRATYSRRFASGPDLLLSGTGFHSDGQRALFFPEFDDPATNNGIAERADGDQFTKLFGRVSAGNLTLQGLYGTRDKAIPTASFGTVFDDPRSQTIETLGFLDLQYARKLRAQWELASRLSYDRYGYDGDYVYGSDEESPASRVINKDFARGNSWGAEIKASRRVARIHRVALGSEYRNNFRQDQYNYDLDPFAQYLDDQRVSQNWALYAQDEIAVHPKLLLNLGVRHDWYESFGGTTNPRLALIYYPRTSTTLKVLYGEAFRAPNAYELYWRQSGVAKANPALRPETNQTGEVVVEHYLGSRFHVAATSFYYHINDLITQKTDSVGDGLLFYDNADEITTRGLELEAEAKWRSGLQGRVSYTLQHSRNEMTGESLTNSPNNLVQFNLTMPLLKGAGSAGIEFQYVGARRTLAGQSVDGVFVPNITLVSRRLSRNLELSASMYNLTNTTYSDPGSEEHRQDSIVQDGRNFRVKLTYRFARGN
jgi:outer membrane receptor for ferrienterochelin and colicins